MTLARFYYFAELFSGSTKYGVQMLSVSGLHAVASLQEESSCRV